MRLGGAGPRPRVAGRILHHIVSGATWYVHCLGIEHWSDIPVPESMDDIRGLAVALAAFDAQILSAAVLDDEWLAFAGILLDVVLQHFRDEATGGFFDTADDAPAVSEAMGSAYSHA